MNKMTRRLSAFFVGLIATLLLACGVTPAITSIPNRDAPAATLTSSPTPPALATAASPPGDTQEKEPATASPTAPIELPIIMNRGAPANERCVAFNTRPEDENLPVYALPDGQSDLVAFLWNWTDIVQRKPGWYQIAIPQGGEGWIESRLVETSTGCSP